MAVLLYMHGSKRVAEYYNIMASDSCQSEFVSQGLQKCSSITKMLHMLEPSTQHTPDTDLHQMPILRMCLL